MESILAVDTDLSVHEKQTAEWARVGVGTVRADTATEAIARLARGEKFLFVGINEDSVPDFWEPLRIMRDVTDAPIYIITSTYTIAKHTKAVKYGADSYGSFSERTADDVMAGLALLDLRNRLTKRAGKPLPVLVGGDVILSTKSRTVLVRDAEVSLTKKEFEILRHLIANKDQFLTHTQLLRKVWGEEYSENGSNTLWQTMHRLRGKLSDAAAGKEYIKAERDVGYKFLG